MYAAILAGPCVAGILVTGIVDGRPGLRDLLARLRRWHVGWTDAHDKSGILSGALGPALLVGSVEEIGWTGFAVHHLRSRHSILVTGLILGVVWGAWHFPRFWQADSFSGALPLVILLTMLFSWLPPFRVLLVWETSAAALDR